MCLKCPNLTTEETGSYSQMFTFLMSTFTRDRMPCIHNYWTQTNSNSRGFFPVVPPCKITYFFISRSFDVLIRDQHNCKSLVDNMTSFTL